MQKTQSLYTTAWQRTGPGIFIAMMFVIIASASMQREQTSVAGLVCSANDDDSVVGRRLRDLIPGANCPVSHSVQLSLPLKQLRDTEGRITPNGESFFLLLARRTKSLSLSIVLSAKSLEDAGFVTAISARMMNEVVLESTQIRISMDDTAAGSDVQQDPVLTVTITRHETVGGDTE